MDERYDRRSRQFTSVTLAAAAMLIAPALVGLGPSIPLGVAMAAAAALLYLVRGRLRALSDLEAAAVHASTLWLGPAFAALVTVFVGPLSPPELQTIGALVGLAGMANYLVRPLYLFAVAAVERVLAA